jgi:hypothetical protein
MGAVAAEKKRRTVWKSDVKFFLKGHNISAIFYRSQPASEVVIGGLKSLL